MNGFNGTIFAYGQTGAGKSFTMEGAQDPPELQGIIPNSFKHIFEEIAVGGDKRQFLIRASYLEIYNEEIRDLLSKDPKNRLDLKESVDSGVYVKDLTSFVVKSVDEIDHVMQAGKKNPGSVMIRRRIQQIRATVEVLRPSGHGVAAHQSLGQDLPEDGVNPSVLLPVPLEKKFPSRLRMSLHAPPDHEWQTLVPLDWVALGERLVALSDATRILSRNLARFATLRCWCEGRERIA